MMNNVCIKIIEKQMLDVYENTIALSLRYGIKEKVSIDDELFEFIDITDMNTLIYTYSVYTDKEMYLAIVIEKDRILYVIVDEDICVVEETELTIEKFLEIM